MKQKDIELIIVIVFVSAALSLFISGKLFSSKNQQQQVETVGAISTNFPTPDPKYFNSSSIDPAQLIKIGPANNPSPFNGSGQ